MGKKQAIKIYKVPLAHIDSDGNLKSDAKLYGYYSDIYHNNDTYPMGEKLTYSNAKNRHQGRTYDILDRRSPMTDVHMGVPIDKRGWSAFSYASKPDREDSLFDNWMRSSRFRDDGPLDYAVTTNAETGEKHREPILSIDIMDSAEEKKDVLDEDLRSHHIHGINSPAIQSMKEDLQHAEDLLREYYHHKNTAMNRLFNGGDKYAKHAMFTAGMTNPEYWDNEEAYKEFSAIVDKLKDASYRKRDEDMLAANLKDAYEIENPGGDAITSVPILVEFDDDDIIRADDVLKNGYDPGRDFQQEAQLKNIVNKQMIPNNRFRNAIRAYRGLGDEVEGAKDLQEMLKDIQKYFDYDNPMTLSDEHLKYIISDCANDVRNERRNETTKNIAGLLKPKYGI